LIFDSSKLRNGSQSIHDANRRQTDTSKQTYICIRTLHHSKRNIIIIIIIIIKHAIRNRARYYGHTRKRNVEVEATVKKLTGLR
jgi:hypothetical protein